MFEEDMEVWGCIMEYVVKAVVMLAPAQSGLGLELGLGISDSRPDSTITPTVTANIMLHLDVFFSIGIVLHHNSVCNVSDITYDYDNILYDTYKEYLCVLFKAVDDRVMVRGRDGGTGDNMVQLLNKLMNNKNNMVDTKDNNTNGDQIKAGNAIGTEIGLDSADADSDPDLDLDYLLYIMHTTIEIAGDKNIYIHVNTIKNIIYSRL